MQGEIVIGTRLDNKELERDLKQAERELQRFQKEAEKLSKEKIELDITMKDADLIFKKLDDAIAEARARMSEIELGGMTVKNPFHDEYVELSQQIEGWESTRQMILEASKDQYEQIDRAIKENERSQQAVNDRISEMKARLGQVNEFDNIKNSIEKVGVSITGITKKIIGWGLSVFGIRSAFSFITRSMSTLSQYDEKMARDIQYISYLLATAVKPIVEFLIKVVYTLLAYIRYIAKALFNVNLFANSSTEAFQKQNKAMKGTTNSAKELKKTLMGFDEMNILQDNGDVTYGSGLEDLADDLEDYMPSLDDIKISDKVKAFVAGLKTVERTASEVFAGIGTSAGIVYNNLKTFATKTMTGTGTLVAKITEKVAPIVGWVKDNVIDPMMRNTTQLFTRIIQKTGEFIAQVGVKTAQIVGWINNNVITPISAGVASGLNATVNALTNAWNGIKSSLGTIYSTFKRSVIDPIGNGFNAMWGNVKTSFFGMWDSIKIAFSKGGQVFNGIKEGVASVFVKAVQLLIDGINKVIKKPFDKINGLLNSIRSTKILGFKPFSFIPKNAIPVPQIPDIKLAKGGIINQPGRGVPVGYNAIAGERGKEGVIPLTDTQQMELIGEAIGRYVTINATIPVYAYNRQVDRQVQKIRAEDTFAQNG